MIPKLVKSFFHEKHPLKVHPHALTDFSLWYFGLHYLVSCRPGQSVANTGHLARLAAYSRACLGRLSEEQPRVGGLMQQTANGTLQVFDSKEAMRACMAASEQISAAGVPLTALSPEDSGAVSHGFIESLRAQGKEAVYLFSELDTNGDCHKLTRHLASECESAGVTFEYDCAVRGFRRDGKRWHVALEDGREVGAESVVLCGGTESPKIARTLGLRLPMYPVKGYAVTVPLLPGAEQLQSNVVQDSKKLYLAPLGPDHVRITGCAEFSGGDASVDRDRANILLEQACELMPGKLDVTKATYYAGLRPLSADDVPIIGAAGRGIYLNTGHGSKGWTHAFGSAELLADVLAGSAPEIDPSPYDLARFWPLRQKLSRRVELPTLVPNPSRVSLSHGSLSLA